MKKILIITTGGTIAMGQDERQIVQMMGENVLLSGKSLLDPYAETTFYEFANLPSVHLTVGDYLKLRELILKKCGDYDGFVITHGTDILEETAYFLDLTLHIPQPVVITGAMRSSNELASDGLLNLQQSVQTAVSEESRDKGVLVVLNGEIHGARFVQKMHTSHVETFQSPQLGSFGVVDKAGVRYFVRQCKRDYYSIQPDQLTARVAMVKAGFAVDDSFLQFALDSGAKGIVIEAMGLGHVPPAMIPGIERAVAASVPVLVCSRSPRGSVAPVYGFVGGGRDLYERGVIFAPDLPAHKARIKLMVVLAAAAGRETVEEVRKAFGM
ncbi:asparaginase [Effusibacillus pohliae]|uniref:asparaginase n=1 Tax=Effusibacillus pohliae TaxID=232270 RepID=UPI00037FFAB5|nr:asparaginase [Effusibacillus pohliae]